MNVETFLEWAAPLLTMVAAIMTASNLGARVTGWGFALFTAGSIAWGAIGYMTDQSNLIANNAFLTIVNAIGVWRWLGRQSAYERGGKTAADASRRAAAPTLFAATGLSGMAATSIDGETLGKTVEGLIECGSGTISYIVVATRSAGGLEESLRAVALNQVQFHAEGVRIALTSAQFEALPPLEAGDWPVKAAAPAR